MRILIDISHPAHVHFFRNAIKNFIKKRHQIVVVSRDKDITLELLDNYSINNILISIAPKQKRITSFLTEMLVHCYRLYKISRDFNPDIMLQIAGTFIAPVGYVTKTKTISFYDTEFAKLSNLISYPLSSFVCTPDCYEKNVSGNHITYPGYHELAYLHPDEFTPDPNVLAENNLKVDEKFFIVRFVGWAALHDYQENGFDLNHKLLLIDRLSKYGKVLISSESPLPKDLKQFESQVPFNRIHDVMAYASIVIGESSTMASEAAVLGVPSIFISTTPRGYTNELERRYGLVRNFRPDQQKECLKEVERIASKALIQIQTEYHSKRKRLLKEKINVSNWIIDFVEKKCKNKNGNAIGS